MESSRFLYGSGIRVVLVLVCIFCVGCHHEKPAPAGGGPGKKTVCSSVCTGTKSDCGPKDIDVDKVHGVDPSKNEVCVCKDDVVTWKDKGHTFQVEFNKQYPPYSPFKSGETVFKNGHDHDVADDFPQVTCFDYKITVDGTEHDPRIVGGGGHP